MLLAVGREKDTRNPFPCTREFLILAHKGMNSNSFFPLQKAKPSDHCCLFMNLNPIHSYSSHVSNPSYPVVLLCCYPSNFAICWNGLVHNLRSRKNHTILSYPICQSWVFFPAFEGGSLGFCSVLLVGVTLWFNVFGLFINYNLFAWIWDHDD